MFASSQKSSPAGFDYRLIAMDKASDGIGIADASGDLIYANTALLKFYGIEDDSDETVNPIDKNWKDFILQQQDEDVSYVILSQLTENGEVYGEISLGDEDDKKIAEISLTRMEDNGIVITLRDSAQTEDIEREREALKEQLHQAQKLEAVGRLAGGVAHDFNNILAAMNGYAEFLIDDLEPGSEQHQFAINILSAGNQATDLVEKMLAFSRRDENEMKILDVRSAVQETLIMLKASLPKSVSVHTHIISEEAFVLGNATQLSQAVMNLCVNAKDAMENERGKLDLRVDFVNEVDFPCLPVMKKMPDDDYLPLVNIEEVQDKPDTSRLTLGAMVRDENYARLVIADNGTGMSRLIMENIFEPFFTTKPVDKGTGLGLAMVHGVIAAHKGAMVITSTLGKGTAFELLFPIAQGEEIKITPQAAEQKQEEGLNIKVLLVEDQEEVAMMTKKRLQRMGAEVFLCINGHDAMQTLTESPFYYDLVITDQNMPEMTGVELIETAYKEFPDLPFIMMSGYSEERLLRFKEGHPSVKAVLRKPVAKADLQKAIEELF